jgi:hypothetical protein
MTAIIRCLLRLVRMGHRSITRIRIGHHNNSLPFMSSLSRRPQCSMQINEVNMDVSNHHSLSVRPTPHLAAQFHRATTLRLKGTISQTQPQMTDCRREHTQLVSSSPMIEDLPMGARELSRLLRRKYHMFSRNRNRRRNQPPHQLLSLHMPMCPNCQLKITLPWTPTNSIRRSPGAQDHRGSARRMIERRRLRLRLLRNHGVQVLQSHTPKTKSPHNNTKLCKRLSSHQPCLRRKPHFLQCTKRQHGSSVLPHNSRDLVSSRHMLPRLKTLLDHMLHL